MLTVSVVFVDFTRCDNHEAMVLAQSLAAQGESHICNNAMDDNSNGSTMSKLLDDADIRKLIFVTD